MKCEDCRFYALGRPNAIHHREGVCHRYPTNVNMMKAGWCGEFDKRPQNLPKKVVKKTKKVVKKTTRKKT